MTQNIPSPTQLANIRNLYEKRSGAAKDLYGYSNPNAIRSSMLEGMGEYQSSFGDLANIYGDRAGQVFDQSQGYFDQAQGLISGDSPILQAMRQRQSQALGDAASSRNRQVQETLAARGMGGGALSNALAMNTASQMGEQASQGLLGIQKYGLEAGQGLGQLANQGYQVGTGLLSGQGQALGAGAAMTSQANQAAVAQMQTNAANKASYLQAEAERARASKRRSGGLLGGIIGGGLGMLMGQPQLGYALGSQLGSG